MYYKPLLIFAALAGSFASCQKSQPPADATPTPSPVASVGSPTPQATAASAPDGSAAGMAPPTLFHRSDAAPAPESAAKPNDELVPRERPVSTDPPRSRHGKSSHRER